MLYCNASGGPMKFSPSLLFALAVLAHASGASAMAKRPNPPSPPPPPTPSPSAPAALPSFGFEANPPRLSDGRVDGPALRALLAEFHADHYVVMIDADNPTIPIQSGYAQLPEILAGLADAKTDAGLPLEVQV